MPEPLPTADDVAGGVADAVAARTREVAAVLAGLDDDRMAAPSRLPGWSRLTIACHLRFGAVTLRRMTADALAGRPTAYYPGGRAAQRPSTLVPGPGESPADVVRSLAVEGAALAAAWAGLADAAPAGWSTPVVPPGAGGADPTVDLAFHGVLRLTEVEVHGSDLDVGLDRWSDTFVAIGLPFRLAGLPARRGRAEAAPDVHGRWALRQAGGGPTHLVTVAGAEATVVALPPGAEGDAAAAGADVVVEGTARDLLALLLGRPAPGLTPGDPAVAARFAATFPGP